MNSKQREGGFLRLRLAYLRGLELPRQLVLLEILLHCLLYVRGRFYIIGVIRWQSSRKWWY